MIGRGVSEQGGRGEGVHWLEGHGVRLCRARGLYREVGLYHVGNREPRRF